MHLQLSDFQANLISKLVAARSKAQADESEGFKMVFAAHNTPLPENMKINLKDNKLEYIAISKAEDSVTVPQEITS